jgi:hypothetical protein
MPRLLWYILLDESLYIFGRWWYVGGGRKRRKTQPVPI